METGYSHLLQEYQHITPVAAVVLVIHQVKLQEARVVVVQEETTMEETVQPQEMALMV